MKRVSFFLLLIAIIFIPNNSWAQTRVKIGDLYYNLMGNKASVAPSEVIPDDVRTGHPSLYQKDEYIIPDKVTYNGLDFSVTSIEDYAFCGFKNDLYANAVFDNAVGSTARKIVLPSTIESIGKYAFANCKNITSFTIPQSVISMQESSFRNCDFLREFIYLCETPPTGWTAGSSTYVPCDNYKNPAYVLGNSNIIQMITFENYEFNYTGQTPSTIWNNNVEGYTASISLPNLNGEVGSHEEWIPVKFTKGDESFTANVVYRYTVKPAKLTAKVTNVSREYGEENPQLSISYSGFISGENESVITTQPTINTTAKKTSNVGEYPITISGGKATNYELIYENGVLTIIKAPLAAKVNDTTKVYGSQNPAFTIVYYGLKNSETAPAWTTTPNFQTDATRNSNVGQYTVKAVNGIPINYDLGEIAIGKLNITPASLTIKANNAVRQYYSDEPTFSYTCSGFVNGETESVLSQKPTLSTSVTRSSNVGTYEIKVGEALSSNYSISYINGTLTITPRTLTASVGNYERLYNEDNPAFEVKYDGFVNNEDENVLSTKATANTTATKTSNVGTYPIKVTGGNADNYTFNYTSGTLTINKAEQTISWEQDLNGLKVGNQIELTAKTTSELPITYTIDDPSIAEIYVVGKKYYLDCKTEGKTWIMAVQEGNQNYYSSQRIRKSTIISDINTESRYDLNGDGKISAGDIQVIINEMKK